MEFEAKTCAKCRITFPNTREYFRKHSGFPDGLGNRCKQCGSVYARSRREISNDQRRDKRRANPEGVAKRHRVERYGAAWDEFDRFMLAQGGACGICGLEHAKTSKGLHLDHDHKTGRVRGLLCCACNLALGRGQAKHGCQDAAALWECGFGK